MMLKQLGVNVLKSIVNYFKPKEKTRMITLGSKVKHTITGFTGIAIARTTWLSGCARITIKPQTLKDGSTINSETFDESELEVLVDAGTKKEAKTGGPQRDPSSHRDGDPK
jgi:hypothetical protein